MTVTIASVRAHGVRQLLVYCNGKRDGDWACHHLGELPIEQFGAEETLRDIQRGCRRNPHHVELMVPEAVSANVIC